MTTSFSFLKRFAAFSAAVFFSILVLQAQDQPPAADKPPVPRLGPVPDMSSWTVQYQYKQADPFPKSTTPVNEAINEKMRKANPRLDTVQAVKSSDNRKKILHYADGSETVQWLVGDFVVHNMRESHLITVVKSKDRGINFTEDFDDLDWIDKAEYKGRQDYQGASCYVYKFSDPSGGDETAYISVKTNLPQAIDTPQAVITYSYTSSSVPIDVPPDVIQQIKTYKESLVRKVY
jgi:hypothetical protein